MTWIDVVDSAIKIGLGALIAAIATSVHAKSKHRQDLRTSQVAREFDLLKTATETVEIFSKAAIRYWAAASDFKVATRDGREANEDEYARAKSADGALQENFSELRRSEALLALLGKTDASRSIESYGDMLVSFRRRLQGNEDIDDQEMQEWRQKILDSRTLVFTQLNSCYRELGP